MIRTPMTMPRLNMLVTDAPVRVQYSTMMMDGE